MRALQFMITIACVAGCSKSGGMTRDEACELISVSSCVEVLNRESQCSDEALEIWSTPEWRKENGTRSPHQECEVLIANACCENDEGAKDCNARTGVSRADVVLGPAKLDSRFENQTFERKGVKPVRLDFDKLTAPLGTELVNCARRASERGACAPSDLAWLEACVAAAN
jgi:hypothetical protein